MMPRQFFRLRKSPFFDRISSRMRANSFKGAVVDPARSSSPLPSAMSACAPRTRARTSVIRNDTKANAAGLSGRACVTRMIYQKKPGLPVYYLIFSVVGVIGVRPPLGDLGRALFSQALLVLRRRPGVASWLSHARLTRFEWGARSRACRTRRGPAPGEPIR